MLAYKLTVGKASALLPITVPVPRVHPKSPKLAGKVAVAETRNPGHVSGGQGGQGFHSDKAMRVGGADSQTQPRRLFKTYVAVAGSSSAITQMCVTSIP